MRDKTDFYLSLRTRVTVVLLLAVVLSGLALLVGDKNLGRIVFVVVLVVGFGYIYLRWRQEKGSP